MSKNSCVSHIWYPSTNGTNFGYSSVHSVQMSWLVQAEHLLLQLAHKPPADSYLPVEHSFKQVYSSSSYTLWNGSSKLHDKHLFVASTHSLQILSQGSSVPSTIA